MIIPVTSINPNHTFKVECSKCKVRSNRAGPNPGDADSYARLEGFGTVSGGSYEVPRKWLCSECLDRHTKK